MPKQKESNINDDNKPAFEDAALGFVYKSLISRDPNKRRIKPVESILSFDPALDDSESDDSDYKPTNLVEDDDIEIETDEDDEKDNDKKTKVNKKKGKSENEQNGKDESESDSDDSDEDSSSEDENQDNKFDNNEIDQLTSQNCITNDTLIKSELLLSNSSHLNGVDTEIKVDPVQQQQSRLNNLKKILVCSVCLGDESRNDDEIVECDSCGISVHELCYGITADDAESIHSNASSASTEPWFCDPCKAGVKNPLCELCPNSSGIFKITDAGRWVHMVCALYTHGITFADVEKYRGPSLSEITFNRWGAKNCSLCEDERYSLSGVCVCCDAGMCKTHFHVTCAQRQGLLCSQHDEVDPYIVYCKLHSDRNTAKIKRRNYLALAAKNRLLAQSRTRQNNLSIEDCITNQRTLSKLISQRSKFSKNFQELEHLNSNPKQIPKLLDSSPSALRRLNIKGELLGHITSTRNLLGFEDVSDIRRKWYIQPAFSVEFISYYIDRNDRIISLQKQSQELIDQNQQLKDIESRIRSKYENVSSFNERIKLENEAIRTKIRHYLSTLGSFVKSSQDTKSEPSSEQAEEEEDKRIKRLKLGRTIVELPEMQTPKAKLINSTSTSQSNKQLSNNSKPKEEGHSKVINIKECATCSQTKDQHSLALCDSCHLYYHLYCLDPPLKRMPKKNRFGGWQCSNCTEKEQEESEQIDNPMETDNPNSAVSPTNESPSGAENNSRSARKLRENPKATQKYEEEVNAMAFLSAVGTIPSGSTSNSRGRPRGRSGGAPNSSNKRGRKPKASTASTTAAVSHPQTGGRKRKLSQEVDSETIETVQSPTRTTVTTASTSPLLTSTATTSTPTASTSVEQTTVTPSKSTASTLSGHTPSKKLSPIEMCNGCKEEVQIKQSVRCDNCQASYHFACLEPPCTKSPKRRGYTWCCYVCEKKDGEKREHSHTHSTNETTNKSTEKIDLNHKKELAHPEKHEKVSKSDQVEVEEISGSTAVADCTAVTKMDGSTKSGCTMENGEKKDKEIKSDKTVNCKDVKDKLLETSKNSPVRKEQKEDNTKLTNNKHEANQVESEVKPTETSTGSNDQGGPQNCAPKNGDAPELHVQQQSEVKEA